MSKGSIGSENLSPEVFRQTRSVCHICLREVPADFIVRDKKAVIVKHCPEHGRLEVFLSSMPEYFKDIARSYYSIVPENLPVRILEISLTPRCSMHCPICSVNESVGRASSDMTLENIENIIVNNRQREFILWGMEPTEHPQIIQVLELFKKYKKNAMLFTNGQKITDFNFLKKLKQAGLKHVYLQFDGFDDSIYMKLRNMPLLKNKLKVLENLKKLNISTTFNVTLAKGINENQISRIIEYAQKNSFVRQIGFLPLIKVGQADSFSKQAIPYCHEFLKIIERETKGLITVENLRMFQKLMHVVYRITKFRRCFWFTMFVLVWDKKSERYQSIADLIDLPRMEGIINKYINDIKVKPGRRRDWILILSLVRSLICLKTINLCFAGLRFFLKGSKIGKARESKGLLFITCTDFCDFYKMDLNMADKYCEELLAIQNEDDEIFYKSTYSMVIEKTRNVNK